MQNTKSQSGAGAFQTERELIVVVAPAIGRGRRILEKKGASSIAKVLRKAGAEMKPLFGAGVERPPGGDATGRAALPDLAKYYRVDASDDKLDELAAELREQPGVEAAYVKPPAEPAHINDMLPLAEEAPPDTADFVSRQVYLNASPDGVDAMYAWTRPGGRGAGVRIIDVEGAWRFTHEDLKENQGGVAGGTPSTDIGWRNHGTAVLGVYSGDTRPIGVTGICSDANARAISIFGGTGSAGAIRQAADLLSAGDILLIELHRPGPNAKGGGQQGFIAVEWWPDDYDAIRYATARGVIVVEAAGNGAEDLDNAIYDTPGAGFPPGWSNPFRRGARDSGAVLVGAGAPPPGTHGRNHGPDRSRLDFSNYGAAVDVQGWGREVTTCAYGDLQGGSDEDLWYTDQFSGTSSASPIVVGSLGCVQGVLRAAGRPLLTPASARALLRSTGAPQQDATGRPATQRIGNRPDIRGMIVSLVGEPVVAVPLYRYWNPGVGDHFYTTNWAELGGGKHGWRYEGVQCHVFPSPVPSSVPLYRYWNPDAGDHFYTTNWTELGGGKHGWRYEGVQCHVFPSPAPGSVPLHRYWNPGASDHFYTTNWAELGGGKHGWRYEGVQCHVLTEARPPTADLGPSGTTAHVPDSFSTELAGYRYGYSPKGPGAPSPEPGGERSFTMIEEPAPDSFTTDNGLDTGSGGTPVTKGAAASFRTTDGVRGLRVEITIFGD